MNKTLFGILHDSTQILMLHSLAHAYCSKTDSSEENPFWFTSSAVTRSDLTSDDSHHVLIVYGHHFCSGTFIGSKMVLTVASCFDRDTKRYEIFVKYGCNKFLDEGQVVAVLEKKEHEYFQYRSELDNDIALLVLESHVNFHSNVRKILLVEPDVALPADSMVVVTGWGTQNSLKSQERYILRSRMMLIDDKECSETYKNVLTSSMFCAKYDVKHRLSDNGGAAVYNGLLVGVSSYGGNSEHGPHIALLTNVSYFYKWIKLNTERLLSKHCSDEDAH